MTGFKKQEKNGFLHSGAFRYGMLAVLFWLGLYFGNYLTVYLQSLGVSSENIGLVSSAAAATGMLGNFLVGRISDRLRTVKWVTVVTLFLTAVCFLLLPLSSNVIVCGVSLVLAWWPLACLFRAPVCALVENWIVRGADSEQFNYGTARAGGSIGSFLSSVLASLLVTALYAVMSQRHAVEITYYVSGVLLLTAGVYALTMRDIQMAKKPGEIQKAKLEKEDMRLGRLFTNYYFVLALLFNFALNICINPPYVFMPYILADSGIDTAKVGLIVGWEALLELPMLAVLVPLQKKFSLQTLLIASGVLFAITTFGQGMSHSLLALLLCGVFFGFANSLSFSCGYKYIFHIAPPELRATAHTLYTIAGALGVMVGNAYAGSLIARIGTRAFYGVFAALTVMACIMYALSFPIGKRIVKTEPPQC